MTNAPSKSKLIDAGVRVSFVIHPDGKAAVYSIAEGRQVTFSTKFSF